MSFENTPSYTKTRIFIPRDDFASAIINFHKEALADFYMLIDNGVFDKELVDAVDNMMFGKPHYKLHVLNQLYQNYLSNVCLRGVWAKYGNMKLIMTAKK